MTDGAGRLVVLPGQGRGYTDGATELTNFAGNDGWSDDVCDGVVRADVAIGGRRIPTRSAWVLTTPPNYGPGMAAGFVTLYDAARSSLVDAGMLDAGRVNFTRDILPLFERLQDMQWVNEGYFRLSGPGRRGGVAREPTLSKLADRSRAGAAFRRSVYERFRDPSFLTDQPGDEAIPDMYGDETSLPQTSDRQWLAVTRLQYAQLGAWAQGRFADDRGRRSARPRSLAALPLDDRPAALDRAALDSCLGGAFHPGIEAPWTLRMRSLWASPLPPARAHDERRAARLGLEAHAGDRPVARRPAGRRRPRRAHALARRPVAQRRGQLPVGLPAQDLDRAADVLACAHPQPGAERGGLQGRHGPLAAAVGAQEGVRAAARLGALRGPARAPAHARADDRRVAEAGHDRRPAGTG